MYIRTFRASSLPEALEQIRAQMGPDASVLHTRQVRDGWLGWLGRTYVEVTAGSKNELTDSIGEATVHMTRARIEADGTVRSSTPVDRICYPSAVAAESPVGYPRMTPPPLPGPLGGYREELLTLGVRESVAERWLASAASFAAATSVGQIGDDAATPWMEHLQSAVARELRLGSPIRTQPGDRRIVALVGPTGVGKTTTVAKLAAGFRIQARRRVGLLTIDTFRIAAVQQLRAYADIMDLPMEVVEHADDMTAALDRLGDVDLVLIDTAGRSPRSDARVEELVRMLRPAQPDETMLVLSSTSSRDSIEATIAGFAPVEPTSAILTKIDETPHLAGAISALVGDDPAGGDIGVGNGRSGRPGGVSLSYVTNGQQVPDDIAVADPAGLMQRLISGNVMQSSYDGDGAAPMRLTVNPATSIAPVQSAVA